ncbi:Sodium/calcium exchanger protein [Gracilaria domingensis]|nr:Sodium/calcium exchanger protein [Gracilaria domingensis]
MESLFIQPSSLPGGQLWYEACGHIVSRAAENGTSAAASSLSEAVHCDVSPASGFVQVLMLLCVYGFVLFNASQLIAHGSELLLMVPALKDIVGSVVLPILGAVPDGAIVLFSGLGENAQEELSVGVGALAGSTAMLLTIPWFLSILAGRVNIRPDGVPNYLHRPKLNPPDNMDLDRTGVTPQKVVKTAGRTMLITAMTYIVIQLAALRTGVFFKADETAAATKRAAGQERLPALFCLVVCLSFFMWYLYSQFTSSPEYNKYLQDRKDAVTQKLIRRGELTLTEAFKDVWDTAANHANESSPLQANSGMGKVLRSFFHGYDQNESDSIDKLELQYLMKDLGVPCSPEEISEMYEAMDNNNNNQIELEEFLNYMPRFMAAKALKRKEEADKAPPIANEAASDDDEAAHGEEYEDLPKDSRMRSISIIQRSFSMMAIGTALVLIFSDPMVGVMSEVGQRIGIPAFYISFVLAPLASNASELIAAYSYASKKTRKTITISLSTLLGAAIMNNTFVLAIFMILITVKKLAWQFTAETASILIVEVVLFYVSQKRLMTMRDGWIALSMFPVSLFIVAFLENVVGLD